MYPPPRCALFCRSPRGAVLFGGAVGLRRRQKRLRCARGAPPPIKPSAASKCSAACAVACGERSLAPRPRRLISCRGECAARLGDEGTIPLRGGTRGTRRPPPPPRSPLTAKRICLPRSARRGGGVRRYVVHGCFPPLPLYLYFSVAAASGSRSAAVRLRASSRMMRQ